MVGVAGFEPATPASRRQCSTRLSYTPNRGGAYTQRLLAWQSPVDTGFAANTSGFPAPCGFAGALAASRCSEPRCIKNKAELSTGSQGWATGHAGASPSGKAAVFGTAIPRFESWRPSHTFQIRYVSITRCFSVKRRGLGATCALLTSLSRSIAVNRKSFSVASSRLEREAELTLNHP